MEGRQKNKMCLSKGKRGGKHENNSRTNDSWKVSKARGCQWVLSPEALTKASGDEVQSTAVANELSDHCPSTQGRNGSAWSNSVQFSTSKTQAASARAGINTATSTNTGSHKRRYHKHSWRHGITHGYFWNSVKRKEGRFGLGNSYGHS